MTLHTPARRWQAARILQAVTNLCYAAGLLITGAALYTTTWWVPTPARLDLFAAALVVLGIAFAAETTGARLRSRLRADRPPFRR